MLNKKRFTFHFIRLSLAICFCLAQLTAASGRAQSQPVPQTPQEQATALLNQMTPEERIGQLFLVTFPGVNVGVSTQIYDLITTHHIGGVVLLAKNDNILARSDNPVATLEELDSLIRQLQQDEWDYSQGLKEYLRTGASYQPIYVPLLIGISQEGDGYPYSQILEGVTMLPNEMALGATWAPELAAETGRVLGKELADLGINLLFGPLLDVLDSPQLDATNNLSTRTFGGDPYWVGKMGQAYIRGVHQGSGGKVAVIASHFPGHGSADRLPEEEVATVRKSLDELVNIDLAPFLAVTGNATSAEETTDALLTSHIRYQGLQGNIRATTRPVSFDPQALSLLLEIPGLAAWRANGGVMVTDDLGNLAVRRFYDLTNQAFDARRVALNAFLAGNDLLYIADFSSSNVPDSYEEAIRTLDFFTQKFREDSAFAQRVNESVTRILTLKYRLYPNFNLDEVHARPEPLSEVGKSGQVTFSVAQEAATLLSPSQADLDTTIPDPPNLNDRIVFISDTRSYQQCKNCPTRSMLGERALQDAVIRLYGPQAGGQIVPNNLSSFSLEALEGLLNGRPEGDSLLQSLQRANWIVFGMLNNQGDRPAYQILRRFLNEKPSLFQQKRLIVFAFNAPYYLDATDISKLSAYYALYSKAPGFVDVAAYLLFGELRATGASPVSVPGVRYNLNEALFPDPNQTIPLQFDLPAPTNVITGTTTPEPAPPPEFRLGDVIPLRTGVIVDHNRNPVPDGTPVTFVFSFGGEGSGSRQVEFTKGGVARTTYSINAPGALEIRAESETARSEVLRVDIPVPGAGTVTTTLTEEPTPTPTIITLPPTPMPTIESTPASPAPAAHLRLSDWIMAVLVATLLSLAIYRLAALIGQVRWGVRAGFLTLIGGLISYSYLALMLYQNPPQQSDSISLNVFLSTLGGGILGLVIALGWRFTSLMGRGKTALEETTSEALAHQGDSQTDE